MIKWFFILSGIVVGWFLLMRFIPSLFQNQFELAGYHIPWAVFPLAIIFYLGIKLKGK